MPTYSSKILGVMKTAGRETTAWAVCEMLSIALFSWREGLVRGEVVGGSAQPAWECRGDGDEPGAGRGLIGAGEVNLAEEPIASTAAASPAEAVAAAAEGPPREPSSDSRAEFELLEGASSALSWGGTAAPNSRRAASSHVRRASRAERSVGMPAWPRNSFLTRSTGASAFSSGGNGVAAVAAALCAGLEGV